MTLNDMPIPYDETDAPLVALRRDLRRRRIVPGETVWAISEAPAQYPGQIMARLKIGGMDASGAIAWTACDAMCDAAWILLNEEGAMDNYTQSARTTQARSVDVLNRILRAKGITTRRLVCELREVESTQPDCVNYIAIIKVDGVEYMRGGAQKAKRVAKEDAAQALMMDVARFEEMLATVQNSIGPSLGTRAGSHSWRKDVEQRSRPWPTGDTADPTERTPEKLWSTSSATESEEDRWPDSRKTNIVHDEADRDANQRIEAERTKNRKRGGKGRRKAANLAAK